MLELKSVWLCHFVHALRIYHEQRDQQHCLRGCPELNELDTHRVGYHRYALQHCLEESPQQTHDKHVEKLDLAFLCVLLQGTHCCLFCVSGTPSIHWVSLCTLCS